MKSKLLSETSKTKAWQMGQVVLVCMFKVPTVKGYNSKHDSTNNKHQMTDMAATHDSLVS